MARREPLNQYLTLVNILYDDTTLTSLDRSRLVFVYHTFHVRILLCISCTRLMSPLYFSSPSPPLLSLLYRSPTTQLTERIPIIISQMIFLVLSRISPFYPEDKCPLKRTTYNIDNMGVELSLFCVAIDDEDVCVQESTYSLHISPSLLSLLIKKSFITRRIRNTAFRCSNL